MLKQETRNRFHIILATSA